MLKKIFMLMFFISFVSSVLALWHRPLLNKLSKYMVVNEKPAPADAIVVLSGGSPARMLEAIKLFKQGLAPQIILTREHEQPYFKFVKNFGLIPEKDPAFYIELAKRADIAPKNIYVLPKYVTNTAQEAAYVGNYARQENYKTLLVITSSFHTGRAKMTFEHFNPGLKIICCGAAYENFDRKNWYNNRATLRTGIFEIQKLAAYHIMFTLKPLLQKLPIKGIKHEN